ncbi:hypothetical protein [Rubritalea tangerina]
MLQVVSVGGLPRWQRGLAMNLYQMALQERQMVFLGRGIKLLRALC